MRIKNAEEKMFIMGCYKCNSNRSYVHIFSKSNIYRSWINRWNEDFLLGGKHPKVSEGKFVKSEKDEKGQLPLETYKDYQYFLDDVTELIMKQYDKKLDRKQNFKIYKERLAKYREECLDDLVKKCNMVFDGKYYVAIIKRKFNNLALYAIYDENNTDIFQGNYEDTLSFMESVKKMKE